MPWASRPRIVSAPRVSSASDGAETLADAADDEAAGGEATEAAAEPVVAAGGVDGPDFRGGSPAHEIRNQAAPRTASDPERTVLMLEESRGGPPRSVGEKRMRNEDGMIA